MDPVSLILSIGTINGLIIGIVLLNLRNANPLATRIFGVIVILISLIIGEELIQYLRWHDLYPHLLSITDGFLLLISPLIYLYALLVTEHKKKLVATDFFHGLPFLLFTVYLLPFYLLPANEKLTQANYDPLGILSFLKATVAMSYFIKSLLHIIRYSKSDRRNELPLNNYRNIKWFKGLLFALISTGVLSFMLSLLFQFEVVLWLDPDTLTVIILSLIFYANSFILMRNPFILWGTSQFDHSAKKFVKNQELLPVDRYKTSPLSIGDLRENMQLLMKTMETAKPYLNPQLTPLDLETETGIKAYYISQTLNEVLNKNFYEFVNAYRVEESKRRIRDPQQAHKTILSLGLESGFNSKSSFNRVFKNYTGITPTQFRRKFNLDQIK